MITKKLSFTLLFLIACQLFLFSQRKSEKLDRGVVAVRNSSANYFVSWRFLATDPENIQFNLYAKRAGMSSFSKLNNTALTAPNFQTAAGSVSNGTELYVKPIINGVEGDPSDTFLVNASGFNTYRSAYLDISYNPANDGLDIAKYSTKFVWPADLDGDGEYDFVVDRLSTDGGTHKVQAYLRNGTLLWTIDVGPNVSICDGQDDMVIAYDMNGDNKAEVVIKSSDGTKFADNKGVLGSVSLDTDNDGIVNYSSQSVKNPPQYITVIDGLTGIEKNSIEMKYPSNYSRTNKSDFMSTEYSNLNGHMSILYLDGKHPSVGFIYKTRAVSGYHWYYASAYGYNATGQWVNHYNWERGSIGAAEFHSIRAADVDFDGRDELLDGGYGIKYDGTLAFNANISHGDRFRVGDIDPDRPGLETFAIQQNASNMLGMLLYESHSGKAIKKWFMSAVGDVGRGECMDIDSTHWGYEMYSTMPNIYNAKGNVIYEGSSPFPNEGVWWDGDLAREELNSADGNGFNADIRKYSSSSHSYGTRLIEFAKMTNWQVKSEYGRRPAFFGDIAGDWREEVILEKKGIASDGTTETCPGFVAFSTDYPTSVRLYCLMQNPAYRMQATTKGYYQSAFPDYYLGFHMPQPPIPPVLTAKLTWKTGTTLDKSSNSFVLEDETTPTAFSDGDDIMFDISGNNNAEIQLNADLAPARVLAMNPKNKDYVISGNAKFTGNMDFIKSMYGNFTLNGNHTYTGKTIISEGTLTVNGSLNSPVEIHAKGTLAGNATLNAGLNVRKALNIEGARIMPGASSEKAGKITINSSLNLNNNTNLHFDFIENQNYKNDSIVINGDFTVSATNNIIISSASGTLAPGTYTLITWNGTFSGSLKNFNLEGLSGIPALLQLDDKSLKLIINALRTVGKVQWTGVSGTNWDFVTENFKLNNSATNFVSGDSVEVDDSAITKIITANDNFNTSNITFKNNSSVITLKGTGGISGTGNLEKTGRGLLNIETTNNSYTGKTILNNATVQLTALNDAGLPGSLGAAAVQSANISLTNSKLIINTTAANTNRGMTLIGNDTINVLKSNGVVSISGIITGLGKLVKNGAGQLNLSGNVANTYSGGTVISGGTLAMGSLTMNTYGLGNGTLTFENGGKLIMYYNTGDYNQKPTWNIVVPENQSGTLVASGRCVINGTISGAGTLNYNIPYVRADLVAGGANFTGRLNIVNNGGAFRITTNSIGFPLANIHLSNAVDMAAYSATGASSPNSSTVVKVGSLSGVSGTTLGSGTWQIGSDNRDATFNGTISATANVTKLGTGNWTLTGANLNASAFNVSGGKLIVSNTAGSGTGTGTVTIRNGATLAGTGTIGGGVVMYSGSVLMPGNLTVGTLNVGGSVSLQAGSRTIIKISGTTNDKLAVAGTLALNGTLEIQNKGAELKAGDSFIIFNSGSYMGNFASIEPEIPATGLKWNTSKIYEGIISVDVADNIENISDNEIKIYPTLVNEYCMIESNLAENSYKIEIIDQVGKVLFADIATSNIYKLNTSKLQSGFYFIRINLSNSRNVLKKFIKQ